MTEPFHSHPLMEVRLLGTLRNHSIQKPMQPSQLPLRVQPNFQNGRDPSYLCYGRILFDRVPFLKSSIWPVTPCILTISCSPLTRKTGKLRELSSRPLSSIDNSSSVGKFKPRRICFDLVNAPYLSKGCPRDTQARITESTSARSFIISKPSHGGNRRPSVNSQQS